VSIRRTFQAAALAAAPLLLGACTNQVTPEGHQGYVYHVPLFFGAAHYVETLTGPTSTGVTWRHYVVNVDIRPKNYTEDFSVLSKDNLLVGFQAHARIAVRANSVKQLIEEYGSADPATPEGHPEWFVRAVRQQYRSAVRDVVYTYDAYDIQTKTQDIGMRILQRLRDEYGSSPVEFEAISIGNITYPDAINAEIQQKLAAEQDLERMNRERQIAEQEAQIMITQAKGRASAQRIVNETLTPLYVQHEMIEGFRALAKSPRVTIVASPSGAGGAPVILNLAQ
jgi:regulator of protease activity HflC (stomatin/prohibitin superfamily)